MPSILLDPSFPSPFDLPRLVKAQDPPVADAPGLQELLDNPPTAPPPGEDTDTEPEPSDSEDTTNLESAAEEPESQVPTSEELVQEIETSPSANWQQYLQPILKDIKNTVRVPIELRHSYMVPYAKDPDLGFYITGTIVFLEEVPLEYRDLPKGEALRYVAYVSPDGIMSKNIDLIYSTQPKPSVPDYHSTNPNVYR